MTQEQVRQTAVAHYKKTGQFLKTLIVDVDQFSELEEDLGAKATYNGHVLPGNTEVINSLEMTVLANPINIIFKESN